MVLSASLDGPVFAFGFREFFHTLQAHLKHQCSEILPLEVHQHVAHGPKAFAVAILGESPVNQADQAFDQRVLGLLRADGSGLDVSDHAVPPGEDFP
jgi:hypothetical protein